MPTTLDAMRDQMIDIATKCQAIVDDKGRPWLAADGDTGRKQDLEQHEKGLKELQEQYAVYAKSDDVLKQFQGIADQNADFSREAVQRAKTLGEQLTDSAAFKQAQKGGRFQTGAIELKAGEILGETNFSGTGSLTSASGAAGLLVPQYLTQPVQKLFQRLTVADLMPDGVISGSSLIYPIESTVTNNAATVAEGGLKPASVLGLTNVTELMHKIATRLKISDETLQDIPAIQSYVNARLVLFVKIKEEQQLLAGAGTGSELTGIQTRSGKQTTVVVPATAIPLIPSVQQKLEAIYQQITNIRVNAFVEPDAIVIDPVSWQQLRMGKDLNGQYFGGGPFTGAYGQGQMVNDNSVLAPGGTDIWQLRTVVTSAQTAGQALVGGFQTCAQVFRKGGLTVEMTNSNEDDFNNNLVSIRAEERLLLAVYRPGGFGLVTGLNNAQGAAA
jgi:HK97 family phage major capsid protein